MPKRKIPQIDPDTGEVKGILVWMPERITSIYGSRWLQISQTALLDIAADKELTGNILRVYLALLSITDFENYITIPVTELAERLGIHRPDVSKAIHVLLKKGILLQGPKAGQSSTYRLSPLHAYKGKHVNARKFHLEVLRGGKNCEKFSD